MASLDGCVGSLGTYSLIVGGVLFSDQWYYKSVLTLMSDLVPSKNTSCLYPTVNRQPFKVFLLRSSGILLVVSPPPQNLPSGGRMLNTARIPLVWLNVKQRWECVGSAVLIH